jgi:citrate lyase subunit beta/citryl-CoA lyase
MVTERPVHTIVAPLFVPATRLDRIGKAAASGADAIIVDLEDAVADKDKPAARAMLANVEFPPLPVILRINGALTPWHADDCAVAASLHLAAVMLPKSENAAGVAAVAETLGGNTPLIALVETARGLANLDAICGVSGVGRLAFGSVDFSADIGCAHRPESLLFARSQIVLASRLADLPGPLDGVTLAIDDEAAAEADARGAAALGFSGKLCIHPRQIAPVVRGFSPSAVEAAWADRVLGAPEGGAASIDGIMIDAPVRRRAEQIRRRSDLMKTMAMSEAR